VFTLVLLLLAQMSPCAGESAAHARVAVARAEAFDLAGAAAGWSKAAEARCSDAEIPSYFLQGFVAARAAYALGGSPESLQPVHDAVAALDARGGTRPGLAQVARYVLLAAAAAAQSERDQMTLLLEHALHLEAIQIEAGQGGVPGVTAHEAAGDLFLQVHRYEDARRYYIRAAGRLGMTPRIRLGLARVAVRLGDSVAACGQYGALVAWWGGRDAPPPEILEARTAAEGAVCQPTQPRG
jgi:hypothetical protein